MKAKTVRIKRSTILSVLLVGAVIAFCSAGNVRAEPLVPHASGADELRAKA